eukprot:1846950-Prymnesium_polylepis.2
MSNLGELTYDEARARNRTARKPRGRAVPRRCGTPASAVAERCTARAIACASLHAALKQRAARAGCGVRRDPGLGRPLHRQAA